MIAFIKKIITKTFLLLSISDIMYNYSKQEGRKKERIRKN